MGLQQVSTDPKLLLKGTKYNDDVLNQVILLGFDYHTGENITELFKYLVDQRCFPAKSIDAADLNPCDYMLHYVKKSLKQAAFDLQDDLNSKSETPRWSRPDKWKKYMERCRDLVNSKESIARYFRKHPNTTDRKSSRLYETLDDYHYLIRDLKEESSQQQKLVQYDVSTQAIEEARKSLEQADAVRRLVAFSCPLIAQTYGNKIELGLPSSVSFSSL